MQPEMIPERKDRSMYYRGPIQGWDDHFQEYIRRKAKKIEPEEEGLTFQPQINERSKKIAEGMSGKVEDRLI